jgi:hypothetical protein
MNHREPLLVTVAVADLRPTQITVGYREVKAKRHEWAERSARDGEVFLGRHMIPVLKGPKGRPYVIDHHHLARALHDEGVKEVAISVVADLSKLAKDEFWTLCDNKGWCHPYDATGVRRGFDDIPKGVAKLVDDPYRSLAGELRRQGGFAKDTTPFSEFIWADFLRRRIKREDVDKDFDKAMAKALRLAKSPLAGHLPGWCGPILPD